MPTASLIVEQRERARLLGAVAHVGDVAEPDELCRCARPRRAARTPARFSRRPLSRIERSSRSPVTRPTGAARFWSWSACTTCPTLTPAACSATGSSSTVSSRSTLPLTATSATPGIERSSRVIDGSASRVSSACDSVVRRERERDDRPVGVVELLDDRLLHLERQVGALRRDGVAQVLRRLGEVLPELELDHDEAEAVVRLAADVLHAADRGDLLLDRIEDLLLHAVGRRARDTECPPSRTAARRRGTRRS